MSPSVIIIPAAKGTHAIYEMKNHKLGAASIINWELRAQREHSGLRNVFVPVAVTERGPLDYTVIGFRNADGAEVIFGDGPFASENEFRACLGD